ncbi:hypothetical protein GGE45_002574 [Rhizobium aethiopicum]|uniref:Uncharacterized protein n=1 Tax=Rhizobium aethiopicum TaxID=1138170 RepID=A0A7W6MDT0_9HYPH|nr:hypothetical protein [Rhizobium aethiopicum]MBB4190017.1 hypothetical protein [Rhizobium aethiopicum]MBB4580244.1 hypothetical protein [Rhizobium aethiopicum]
MRDRFIKAFLRLASVMQDGLPRYLLHYGTVLEAWENQWIKCHLSVRLYDLSATPGGDPDWEGLELGGGLITTGQANQIGA